MSESESPLAPETEDAVQTNGGPLKVDGQRGEYVVMTMRVFDAMLGIGEDEEAETIASVRRGIADVAAGRSQEIGEAFDQLEVRYAA
jgi:hypothetical protein